MRPATPTYRKRLPTTLNGNLKEKTKIPKERNDFACILQYRNAKIIKNGIHNMSRNKKYRAPDTDESTQAPDKSELKEFEVSYIITGTLKTNIKATDIDDAIRKASTVVQISKMVSGIAGMNVDSAVIDRITDENNIAHVIDNDIQEYDTCEHERTNHNDNDH